MNETTMIPETENQALSANAIRAPRQSFYQTDFKELDRELSPREKDEWNAIYASFSSHSILNGMVIGVDKIKLPQQRGDEWTDTEMSCLVIVDYRVKVLIPAPFVWSDAAEHPDFILNSMLGARLDYIITAVDREGGCAIGSRTEASVMNRRHAKNVRRLAEGERISCTVLTVGPTRLRATTHGYDFLLSQNSLSYSYLGDLREIYRPGQELQAVVIALDDDHMTASVKLAEPNPYEGAILRHPVGSRRMASITGKYAGGVFCRLPDGCTVVCSYAQQFTDSQFMIGNQVVVQISGESRDKNWLRATIRGKIG